MKKNGFVFEIGELYSAEQGAKQHLNLDEKVDFKISKENPVKSNLTADVTLMRVEDGIHVLLQNIKIDIEFTCSKCLTKYIKHIKIPQTERVYFFEKHEIEDSEIDTFVDKKALTIDITDFLRQEIILHFPMIPVCSKGCKGLCPVCGQNLNEKDCGHNKKSIEQKPLAALKDLYKDNA